MLRQAGAARGGQVGDGGAPRACRAGSHIYWSDGRWIGRANLDGSAANPSFIMLPDYGPSDLAIDTSYIYWAHGNGKIGRANLDGSNVIENFVAPIGPATGVAVTPTRSAKPSR